MYIKKLDGAIPVSFAADIFYSPPDCEGEDMYHYTPMCPTCGYIFRFEDFFHPYKYCHECGQKLWWDVEWPKMK